MIWIIIHATIILFAVYQLKPNVYARFFWTGVAYKIGMGFVVGYYYFYRVQGGDTVSFDTQALEWYDLASNDFSAYLKALFSSDYHLYKGEARTELFVKITSIFYLITGGNYWITSAWYSVLSFCGAWYLILSIKKHYPNLFLPALVIFLFLPSPALWSSGVMKDALVNGSLLYLGGIAIRYHQFYSFKTWEYGLTLVSVLILFYLKHYLFALVLPILMILIWTQTLLPLLKTRITKVAGTSLLITLAVLLSTRVNPILHVDRLPQTIADNYHAIYQKASGPKIQFENLTANWSSVIQSAPKSLISGLFRPWIWEVPPPYLPFAIESLGVILLTILNLYYVRFIRFNTPGIVALLFCLILALFLPLVSPGFGSLVRYKVAFLPFLVFLLSITPFQRLLVKRTTH